MAAIRPAPRTQELREVERWREDIRRNAVQINVASLTDLASRSHQDLQNILGADETSTDTAKNKHPNNLQCKNWEDHRNATIGHGATGAVVGTTNIQTLTNKTLTSPTLTTPTITGGTATSTTINDPTIANTLFEDASVSTTSDAVTTLWSKALADESAYFFIANITAKQDTSANRAAYTRKVLMYRDAAGVATIQGAISAPDTIESNAAWDATFTTSVNNALLVVTGVAATNISWKATLESIEIT